MARFKEDTYVRLKLASYGLGHIFGISVIRWYPSGELEPYVANVMEYIEKQMILSGATELKQKLDYYDELYHNIMDQIIYGELFDLLVAMGIPTDSDEDEEEVTGLSSTKVLFVTATVNFITSLYMQLRYNYSHLYLKPQTDCHSCSGNGNPEYVGPDYGINISDPRPMHDGYEFGCGTQELWGPGLSNI